MTISPTIKTYLTGIAIVLFGMIVALSISTSAYSMNQDRSGGGSAGDSCTPTTPEPTCVAGYGDACTATNACNASANGTIGCLGGCSAVTPALPNGWGTVCYSAANSCGMQGTGSVTCDGSCNAVMPSNDLCIPDVAYGCTDPSANNYDNEAEVDNGSCRYDEDDEPAVVLGCIDPTAINYNTNATVDNSSCYYQAGVGCTDPTALNYNPTAATPDGSCVYEISGCTDSLAGNYNPFASIDDGTCVAQVCPVNTILAGNGQCVPLGTVIPAIECSLDQDWTDNDNSCSQLFSLQSINQPVYLRANSADASCPLSNYSWQVVGGSDVTGADTGNVNPAIILSDFGVQDPVVRFSGDVAAKIFYRPVTVSGSVPAGCTTAPALDVVKIKLLNIKIIEE